MTTFTVVSFTEGERGWYNQCGDYIDGSPSDLDIQFFSNAKECGYFLAYIERQYETTRVLIDGKDQYFDDETISLSDEVEKYRSEQSLNFKTEQLKKQQQDEERRRILAEEEAQRLAHELEQKEREQLALLKSKYE